MQAKRARIPIVCPECGREALSDFSMSGLIEALQSGVAIRLYAKCHDRAWQASGAEREQLRQYVEAIDLARPGR